MTTPLTSFHRTTPNDLSLRRAVVRGDRTSVARFLAGGADPDQSVSLEGPDGADRNGCLLDLAWANVGLDDQNGDTIMALLMEHGADLTRCHPHTWWQVCSDRLETVFEPFVRAGSAGLMASTASDHPLAKLFEDLPHPLMDSWVTLMLEHGLAPHHRIEGTSVLGLAARVFDDNLVKRLIAAGADPEDVDDEHRTLLQAVRLIEPREAWQRAGQALIVQQWVAHQDAALRQAVEDLGPAGAQGVERLRPRL